MALDPGSASWVIPTAFSVIAIKQFTVCNRSEATEKRIRLGVEMLLDRVCVGGGWNSGNSVVYGVPLPAHVEARQLRCWRCRTRNERESNSDKSGVAKTEAAIIDSVESLAWCILSLFVYQEPLRISRTAGDAHRRRPRNPEQCNSRHRASRAEVRRDDSSVRGAAMKLDRRRFLGSAAGVAATMGMAAEWLWPKHSVSYRRPRSSVAMLNADEYSEKIEALLMDGLRLFRLNVLGKTVLLKPNLVEDLPGPVNTNATLIGAAARCFLRLGAARVVIGEGPGHQRDTELVVQAAGLKPHLSGTADRVRGSEPRRTQESEAEGQLQRPRTSCGYRASVLDSDFVVSMPKVKTHHWAGVTLSLKNMFGIVPGMKYGWPKNLLHWNGIHESILDICATVPIHFVIADGITAMEGNGPLQGSARQLGKDRARR